MKKTLYEEKNDSLWVTIEANQTEDEKIIIYGHDSGEIVKKIKHQYDYEYYLTIEKEDTINLIEKLELKKTEELFDWFEKEFSSDDAVSKIKDKLNDLQIKYQSSIW